MNFTLASIIAIACVIIGMVIASAALFADRAKGRRRCPKCWYDMSAHDGLACPECETVAKRERSLHKARRRWRWITMAVILLVLGGSTLASLERARRAGWSSPLPTTIVILAVKFGKPEWAYGHLDERLAAGGPAGGVPDRAALCSWQEELLQTVGFSVFKNKKRSSDDRAFALRWAEYAIDYGATGDDLSDLREAVREAISPDTDEVLRVEGVRLVRSLPVDEAFQTLTQLLDDPSILVQHHASFALFTLRHQIASYPVEVLMQMLNHREAKVRAMGLHLVRVGGGAGVRSLLVRNRLRTMVFQNPFDQSSGSALRMMPYVTEDDAQLKSVAGSAMNDADSGRRAAVIDALYTWETFAQVEGHSVVSRLSSNDLTRLLVRGLRDGNEVVRIASIESVANLAAESPQSLDLEQLRPLVQGGDPAVAQAVWAALRMAEEQDAALLVE